MAKKEAASPAIQMFPMLKTVEQMSKISGIGENKLRELMDNGELEYIQNGNRRLIADAAIWDCCWSGYPLELPVPHGCLEISTGFGSWLYDCYQTV